MKLRDIIREYDSTASGVDPDTVPGQPPQKPVPAGTQDGPSPEPQDTVPEEPGQETDQQGDEDQEGFDPDFGDIEDESDEMTPEDEHAFSTVSNSSFVTDYDHDDESELSPKHIAMMDTDELTDMSNKVQGKMRDIEVTKRHGLYDDKQYIFLQKLLSFVKKIYKFKSS